MALQATVSERDEPEFGEFLRAQLREYNNDHSPFHREARQPGAVVPLNVMLRDETGNFAGGLCGMTIWDWLEIDRLFVPAGHRGQGWGALLLQTAETIAVQRGCRHVHLRTYEFQARTFYERHGYRVIGRLDGYPPGSAFYWMRKDFDGQY